MGIRLLPLIVVLALLLFSSKIYNIFQHNAVFLVSETRAKSAEAEPKKEPEKEAEKKDSSAKEDAAPAEEHAKEAEDKGKDKGHEKEADAEDELKPAVVPPPSQPNYTADELELLQNLSKRRQELDAREKDLALQSIALKAAAAKMDERVNDLKALQDQATAIVKEYQKKEDAKVKSLVKIYENMKPKDAARIFENMEMPLLLEVVGNMKEAKAAPILAKMDPNKAKSLTAALAERRKLPDPDNSYLTN